MRSLSALAVALLALSLVVGPVVGASSAGTATVAPAGDVSSTHDVDPKPFAEASPHVVYEVNVTASGDARWSVSYRYLLNSSNETEAFRRFGEDVAAGRTELRLSRQRFQRFADQAQGWTGREMTIEGAGWAAPRISPVEVETTATPTTTAGTTTNGTENGTQTYVGELTFSFVWTNFATVDGNTVSVGDAFSNGNETWFPRLYENSRFVLNSPTNYGVRDSPDDKGPDDGTLVWDGPVRFDPGYLEATYFELAPQNRSTPPGPGPQGQGLTPLELAGLVGLLVVAAAGGAYLFAKRQSERPEDGGEPAATPNGGQGPTSDGGGAAATEAEPGAATEEAPSDEEEEGTAAGTAEIDEELLSDEERVLRLLDENGGRMKQANIVKETGWSNAKVSQLLSGMADDEEIRKLRIGRENLITLPDESLGDFDDEP